MKITTRLRAGELVRTIKRFPGEVKRTGESILRQESRQFAKELARWTLPIGLNDSAWKKLAFRIAHDIRHAIVSPRRLFESLVWFDGKPFAKSVWALINGKQKRRVRTLAQMLTRSKSPFAQLLISGNVRQDLVKAARTGAWGNVPLNKSSITQIVTNERAVASFIKKMQRRAGFAKAGWSSAARSLSGRNIQGIPTWAGYGRHKTPGFGVFTKKGKRIRLTNEARHSRDALPPAGEARAKWNATRNLRLALAHAINALSAQEFSRGRRRRAA